MGSSNPLSITPQRRYQGSSDLLVEDVQKDDEWLYSPSTEPSPALSGGPYWESDAPPPNLRTSLDRGVGVQSQVERSNSLRGRLGLKPQSSRASSQSVTPQDLSPRLMAGGDEDSAYDTPPSSTTSENRSLNNKQSLKQVRSMFRDDHNAKQQVKDSSRRSSAPSAYALKRTSSNIPAPRGYGPPSPGEKSTSSGSPSTSLVERTVSAGSRIPFAPGVRRANSLTLSGASGGSSADSAPRRASDGASKLNAYRPQEPDGERQGYTAMQGRVKAGTVRLPGNESQPQVSGGSKKPASPATSSPRVSDVPSPKTPGYTRKPSSNSAQSSGRPAVSSPSTPGSVSRLSSAGSFSGKTAVSTSANLYMTPSSGTSSKYVAPSQSAARSVNQPARTAAFTPSSTKSLSMGSSSKAGFNSSVPRTFNFLEETTPKRRGSTLEREEMASLPRDQSPASPEYGFPDEESPRRPVAHADDQSWAHVRSAVAQAKRSRTTTGSSRDSGRGDPLRNSNGRSSADRNNSLRLSGGSQGPHSSSHNGGDGQGGAASLLTAKRHGSSGNLAAPDVNTPFAKSSTVSRSAYFPTAVSYQPEPPAQDMLKRGKAVSSDDESWGPGEGSVSGESGPWTGSVASDEEEENGAKLGKKGASKRRRRFRKSRTRFRGTESGVEGDESEIDIETASLATAGSPLPANLMSLPDNEMLPDTPSDTMSVDNAEGGKELPGSRRDGVRVLEPLPDVSIDAEEGLLAVRAGTLAAESSATAEQRTLESEPQNENALFDKPTSALEDGQSQANDLVDLDAARSSANGRSVGQMNKEQAEAVAAGNSMVDGSRESLQSEPLLSSPPMLGPDQEPLREEAAQTPRTVLTLDETPAVAKGSLALEPAAIAEQGGKTEQGSSLQKSPSERLVEEAAVEQVGMLREGQLPDDPSERLVEEAAVEQVGMLREGQLPDEPPVFGDSHSKADIQQFDEVASQSKALAPQQPAEEVAIKQNASDESPLEKPKPPVLSFDDIPVRGVQGMYSERPPMHSPPPVSPGAATPPDKKKGVVQADASRPSAESAQKQQVPKTEVPRRIRSTPGGAPAILGLRSGSSGANLEKAIASMNRRNSIRRSSDRSTATGTASENFEWERSSMADETYSDISTPSTMLSRKTLEEAAESAIFCSSIVHDVVYKAASLAQEKEDLTKLGKASGELEKLVSKQKGPEVDKAGARMRSGQANAAGGGHNKHTDERPAKKQPACGCTIL